jgi:putative inorganic carbon (HCO3(-)) transporter
MSLVYGLIRYWQADVAYALGANLDRVESYQQAYPQLMESVNIVGNEPVYKDELAINLATLATALYAQKDTTNGAAFAKQAIDLSNDVTTNHPNNVVYWKNRVRLFYTLAQGDPQNQQTYLPEALRAIVKATELAPTDAKITYNLGVLLGQNGNVDKAIEILNRTIQLRPSYRDAYFALGLFYHSKAVDNNNKVVNADLQQKAVETYQYILQHIDPADKQAKESLKSWGA